MDNRLIGLSEWATSVLGRKPQEIVALSNDASPRRYYALPHEGIVAVDTPLPVEQNKAFISIAKTFAEYQLNVPQIFRYDLAQGYMLISDLGRRAYLPELTDATVDKLYNDALDALVVIQTIPRDSFHQHEIEHFDHAFVLREGLLGQEWFFEKYLQIELTSQEKSALQKTFSLLTLNMLEQPQVIVHRDYHSRNLMISDHKNPGIIDFQDAVWGAVTYDLLSLVRDCYVAWPQHQVEKWVADFQLRLQDEDKIPTTSKEQFLKWFDLLGVQRHLKALGIFSRLELLYKKPGYIKDIPRTLNYMVETCNKYPELQFLKQFIDDKVLPSLAEKGVTEKVMLA
jgi:aminoglycoside/choline kinase family phosphotransferase